MTTTIRIKKETKELLFGIKGGRTADEYIKECILYFKICRYDPKDLTANPVLDISILVNRKTDQLKGMLVNFQKENSIRMERIDSSIQNLLVNNVAKQGAANKHQMTTEELNEISQAIQLYEKKVEENANTISQLKNKIRMLELEKQRTPTSTNIDSGRLRVLFAELRKVVRLDKFDSSQTTYTANRKEYDTRMGEVAKILKIEVW